MKFEEISPRGFRGEVVQRCEQTDWRMDWQTDGQRMESDHNSSSWAFGSGELKRTHDMPKRSIQVKENGYALKGYNLTIIFFLPSEKRSTLKGKNLLPMGANSFLLE